MFELLAQSNADQFLAGESLGSVVVRSAAVLVAGVAGIFLMLPRGLARSDGKAQRYLGGALCTLALVLLAAAPVSGRLLRGAESLFWPIPDTASNITFYLFAGLSLVSAGMMITSRNPVYSALWFALVLLANSGLYFLQNAEFLAASTIIIYAGAIIVTFLFVIMLASPRGTAPYDRRTREPAFTCLAGLLFGAALLGTIHYATRNQGVREESKVVPGWYMTQQHVAAGNASPTVILREKEPHVAALGRTLYLDQVVSVEAIGLLLLAAVVGAMLIAGHRIEGHAPAVSGEAISGQQSAIRRGSS